MDRQIVYPAQIPLDSDQLNAQRNAYVGLGQLAAMAYGWDTVSASGFACSPGTGLVVSIAPGSLLAPGVVDASAYGTLPGVGSALVRQYGSRDPVTLDVPGAGTVYTVYVTPVTKDADDTVLPFYNAADPSVTYAGSDNSGNTAPTVRQDMAQLGIGTSVPTGAYPLWTITVPAGATSITADMIAQASGAPFYDTIPQLQAAKQDALGFTPVQQGGGSYQDGTQKVYLGAYTRFGTTPGLTIGDTDYGVLVSGTLYSALNSGDLPIYSFHCTSAGMPGCWYGPTTDDKTWLPLARQVDVTAVSSSLASALASQANVNADFSADISDCVSGVDGVNSSAGDKQGTALYFAGGIAKMFAQYDGGNGALAWSNDVTVVNSNLVAAVANQSDVNAGFSADISDRVSGIDGLNASAGDKQGTALYFAGAIAKMFAAYDGGSGALAWSNDVDAVNTSLASTVANQSNINAGFSADISNCVSGTVGMSQSGDLQMQGLCMRYSADNGDGQYPYATYKDGNGNTNNLALVQSNAGTGFSVIYNAKLQYVSASEGYLWVDYVGGGSAKFVSGDCGEIEPSGNVTSGSWTKTGNVLKQTFTVSNLTAADTLTIDFPIAYSGTPSACLVTWSDTGNASAFANIMQGGLSSTSVVIRARANTAGNTWVNSGGTAYITVEGIIS